MGAGRRTETFLINAGSAGSGSAGLQHRGLSPRDLGAVIFVCNGETVDECLEKQLFGLPKPHIAYVQHIVEGMPLFLFNYDDRLLHGVFAAASDGALNIDPFAWSVNGKGPTKYPAQVRVRQEIPCSPLAEKLFSRAIKENYFAVGRFMFELTRKQMHELVGMFSKGKLARSPAAAVAAPLPPPPTNKVAAASTSAWKPVVREAPAPPPPAARRPEESLLPPPHKVPQKVVEDREFIVPAAPTAQVVVQEALQAEESTAILDRILEKLQLVDDKNSAPTKDAAIDLEMVAAREMPRRVVGSELSIVQAVDKSSRLCNEALAKMCDTELRLAKTLEELRLKGECLKELEMVRAQSLELATVSAALSGEVQALKLELAELKGPSAPQVLYLIGGFNGEVKERSVDKFQLRGGDLSTAAPLLAPRSCAASGVEDGKVVMFGGIIGENCVTSTEIYDPEGNFWSLSKPMSIAREYLGGAVVGSRIFALGGRNGNAFYSEVEVFDRERGWMASVAMLDKRGAFSSPVVAGSIYAMGGTDGDRYLDTVERLDPREACWKRLPAMASRRLWFQAAVWNDKVYVLGGHDGIEYLSSVERFDPRAGKWETIKPLSRPRAHGAAAVVDGTICVVAGLDRKQHFVNTVECYNETASSRVIEVCDLSKRSLFCLAVL